jgi:large subunit ribosomal protein L25
MKKYQLTVTTREGTGRSASRRLRKAEKIPAILYGKHTKPENLAVQAPEFIKLVKEISGRAALIELKRDAGATALSFLQEVQRDPITDRYLHLDLQEVKENEKMVISVMIHVVGEAYGVKTEGGILETTSHRLRIRCLPKDLPALIELNVTELKVGEAIHVGELKPIAGVEFLDDKNQTVVLCVEPPLPSRAPLPPRVPLLRPPRAPSLAMRKPPPRPRATRKRLLRPPPGPSPLPAPSRPLPPRSNFSPRSARSRSGRFARVL